MKGVPGYDIVPDHAADEGDLQGLLFHFLHYASMYPVSVAFYGPVLAVETDGSVFVHGGLEVRGKG